MNELLVRLSGGEDVVNEVISYELNKKLPQKLAKRFQIAYPNKQMDIMSVALLALVRGVNELRGEIESNLIESYLSTRIRTAILLFLNTDKLIPVPRSSRFDAAKCGEPIIEPSIFNINICGGDNYEIADNTYCEMIAEKELREHFNCVLTLKQREILESRLRGMSKNEIAISYGCSRQYIGQVLKEIRKKCYGISIYQERTDILQGCRLLQHVEDSSETLIHAESVRRSCSAQLLESVGNDQS